ncbi:effector-associated domain EAD1-containing protein [Sinosporangium siamense]|uniref:Effector-associated domain-containing protein n=1 Tax=Sinosporangium siamense TaxID=1367973 RepID=A0A919RCV9_9ACTN|nr:hypothetical protein Ssi02_06710 [Sinosporangium siamense]
MITYDIVRRYGVLTALAQVFDSEAKNDALLGDIGADRSRLPRFGTLSAELYWRQVARELSHGMAGPGLAELINGAHELYPESTLFKRYATPLSGTSSRPAPSRRSACSPRRPDRPHCASTTSTARCRTSPAPAGRAAST